MRNGFTLVELVVAISIFALLSVTAYGGLNNIIEQNEQSAERGERLMNVVQTVEILRTDIEQAIQRAIRDEYGDERPALLGARGAPRLLEVTRTGHDNRLGLPRSSLQRVGYELDEDRLLRLDWVMLDRSRDSEPRRRVLLDNVEGIAIRFLDPSRVWHDTWPPLGSLESKDLPRAVEVAIRTPDWGEIVQLYRVPPS